MRARGFDTSVLAEQLELAKRGEALEALVAETYEAFSGVTLGSGIGLLEANGLDDYVSLPLIDVVHSHSFTRLSLTGPRASLLRTSSG